MALSDEIAAFILLLLNTQEGDVEIRRAQIAEKFGCAPSQINYVLATRFSPAEGYIVESRRGGGGFIRLKRMRMTKDTYLCDVINQHIKQELTQDQAKRIIETLLERGILTQNEAALLWAATNDRAIGIGHPMQNSARASIAKSMLLRILAQKEEE